MFRPKQAVSVPPLPMRDGVTPSYLWLLEDDWPDMITFMTPCEPNSETMIDVF